MTRCSSSYDKDFNEVSKDNTLLFENSEGSSAAGMSCLSMRFPCALSIDGISYRNAEQYILDSAGKPGTAEPAGETSGASGCLPCSRKAYRAALRANLEKFRSDPALGEALLSTGDAAIAYADSEDTFWGIGMSAQEAALIQKEEWRGANYEFRPGKEGD